MLRILTDTGSDISVIEAAMLGIDSVVLEVMFDNFEYNQRIDSNHDSFYETLFLSKNPPTTGAASPLAFLEIFESAKNAGDELLAIILSSGLSSTYSSALLAKEMCEYNGITIFDSLNATSGQRILVHHAIEMRNTGHNRAQIVDSLKNIRSRIIMRGIINSVSLLKKGGRLPDLMTLNEDMMNFKTIVSIQSLNGKLNLVRKVQNLQTAKKMLWEILEINKCDPKFPFYVGYSQDIKRGSVFHMETIKKYGITNSCLRQIGGVIGSHVGQGCLSIAYVKQ
jgi:DegV family protein with EDD domain